MPFGTFSNILLLSFYIFISWNMPLFKVWSEDKLKKKFVVAENFAELVSKGKRFVYFMSGWRDRMLHACMQRVIWQINIHKLLFLLVIVFAYI